MVVWLMLQVSGEDVSGVGVLTVVWQSDEGTAERWSFHSVPIA